MQHSVQLPLSYYRDNPFLNAASRANMVPTLANSWYCWGIHSQPGISPAAENVVLHGGHSDEWLPTWYKDGWSSLERNPLVQNGSVFRLIEVGLWVTPSSVTSICYIRGCLHKTTYFRIPKPKKGIHFFTAKETWYSSSPEYNQTLALNPFKTHQVWYSMHSDEKKNHLVLNECLVLKSLRSRKCMSVLAVFVLVWLSHSASEGPRLVLFHELLCNFWNIEGQWNTLYIMLRNNVLKSPL